MSHSPDDFHHPHDTLVSASLRFLSELIAWVSGPWAVGVLSKWLVLPALIVLISLPAVFSTQNDKRKIVVPTPGPIRIGLEFATPEGMLSWNRRTYVGNDSPEAPLTPIFSASGPRAPRQRTGLLAGGHRQ